MLSIKIYFSVISGSSADTKVDFKRAEELASRGLALDPNYASAHYAMARVLNRQGRFDEAIAENERALALDPAMVAAYGLLGLDYMYLGEFEKSLEFSDKAIRLSPHDPSLVLWYNNKAGDYFGLKQYDQAIEWARRAIAINSNACPWPHFNLIPALALTGREAEAREALLRYLAVVPTGPKTIAAWKAIDVPFANFHTDPRFLESLDRRFDGLRLAGVPEG
jgi:adenylate cyclase